MADICTDGTKLHLACGDRLLFANHESEQKFCCVGAGLHTYHLLVPCEDVSVNISGFADLAESEFNPDPCTDCTSLDGDYLVDRSGSTACSNWNTLHQDLVTLECNGEGPVTYDVNISVSFVGLVDGGNAQLWIYVDFKLQINGSDEHTSYFSKKLDERANATGCSFHDYWNISESCPKDSGSSGCDDSGVTAFVTKA